jgi:co-chaperonin GroES (HSP10)
MRLLPLWLFSLLWVTVAHSEIKILENKIIIKNDKNFEQKLETKNFVTGETETHLSETGFIVSSAQSTFENDRFISRWVSLDERMMSENKVNLSSITPSKGLSYGVVSTSKDFETELKAGQSVLIKRYSLKEDRFQGKIVKILNDSRKDIVQVHFIAFNAPELIAGTTCEVEISHIKKLPYKVSLLSLLHMGLEDYIVVKEKDGIYLPKHATIVDQDAETATILVPVSKDLPYVARGAILLKPLLSKVVGHD